MSKHISRNRSDAKPLELILPATSANLGPAFDAAALALKLFLKVRARIAPEFSVQARGRDSEICGQLENHLILATYREILQAEKKPVRPLALRIDNQIPIGKGCGSSAAARLAGIVLAVEFGGLDWTESQIVGEASRREHHPDNAAACWVGGLAVARISGNGEAQIARIAPRGTWPLLLAVPPETLSTEQARRVLPLQYSRADAVANVQNSMLLLAAFIQGRANLLASALDDRLHQPYRAVLCPLLPALKKLPAESGVLGVALSGAGPSVLIFLDSKGGWARAKSLVAAHLRKRGLAAELIPTEISELGAREASGLKTRRTTK
jgi:homoserine kinase